jgi:hypothetical protein
MGLHASWLSLIGTNLAGILHTGSIVKHSFSTLYTHTGKNALIRYWHRTIGLSTNGITTQGLQGIDISESL